MERTKCRHGCKVGESQLPEWGWAGGISVCQCCKGAFGRLGAMTVSRDGLSHGWQMSRELCVSCGGNIVSW